MNLVCLFWSFLFLFMIVLIMPQVFLMLLLFLSIFVHYNSSFLHFSKVCEVYSDSSYKYFQYIQYFFCTLRHTICSLFWLTSSIRMLTMVFLHNKHFLSLFLEMLHYMFHWSYYDILQRQNLCLGYHTKIVFKSVFVLGTEFLFHRIKGVLFFLNSLMNHANWQMITYFRLSSLVPSDAYMRQ